MPNEAEGIDKSTNNLESAAQVSSGKSGSYDLTKLETASTTVTTNLEFIL